LLAAILVAARLELRAVDRLLDDTLLDRVFGFGLYLFLLRNLDTRGLPGRPVA
jgi:hypothetical protein